MSPVSDVDIGILLDKEPEASDILPALEADLHRAIQRTAFVTTTPTTTPAERKTQTPAPEQDAPATLFVAMD
jgi:hypothetical protein